jgi:hypothetical protein
VARTEAKTRKRLTVLAGARPAHCPDRPRPWSSTDAAAAARDFFSKPRRTAVRELIRELCSDDPFDHRCAAELARLVSRREPDILAAYSDLLVEVAATFPMEEWQARGYVLVAAAINATAHSQRMRLLSLVRARLAEARIAVRAMAWKLSPTWPSASPASATKRWRCSKPPATTPRPPCVAAQSSCFPC